MTDSLERSPLRADLLLLTVTLLAAAGWIFSKEALAGMPPLLFIGTRFLLAGLILVLFALPALRRLSRRDLATSAGVGLLFSAALGFWVMGLFHSRHLGESAFINSLGILLVPVVARLLFGDRPPRTTWIALPIALAGFGLLSLNAGLRLEPSQWLIATSALLFSLLINTNTRVVRHLPALPLTAIQLTVVGVLLSLASALVEPWPARLGGDILGWLAASILLSSTLRFFLQIHAQGLTTPSHAAVILMLEAVWTALLAAAWYGETMTLLQLAGCSLIFTALLINRWYWVRKLVLRLAT
ncbi:MULTISPECIES: DMT family transporter [unclassified Halomonas]|uniref:DMT family transporter n=1 Tax=unclassified Halomonas TaxID=2609666 RepID=UPI00288429D7|nr:MULTISPECIES: DMT family transporter [unclassified Halomonas]MDT0500471.1 DMT family transporter [Halomonas sp. PAR7]MDT0511633.1 DMT family transporter [Halomonas sp. LES1]MDT0590079.1 DMT family transporter [Halomonas sp. PAR8]